MVMDLNGFNGECNGGGYDAKEVADVVQKIGKNEEKYGERDAGYGGGLVRSYRFK